jgi:hypothetical protein
VLRIVEHFSSTEARLLLLKNKVMILSTVVCLESHMLVGTTAYLNLMGGGAH